MQHIGVFSYMQKMLKIGEITYLQIMQKGLIYMIALR